MKALLVLLLLTACAPSVSAPVCPPHHAPWTIAEQARMAAGLARADEPLLFAAWRDYWNIRASLAAICP